jgi:hypothetical protein
MENDNKSLFDISFDENVKQNLKAAATWGGIAAIVSLTGSLLSLVNYFTEKGKISRYGGTEGLRVQQAADAGGFISIAITLIIGIILFVFLNKFSRKAKAGVDASDQYLINEGLRSLSTYFSFIGVLLIIMIVLFGLGILIGLGQNM